MEAVRVVLKLSAVIAVAFFVTYGSVSYFYLRADELSAHPTSAPLPSTAAWVAAFSAFSVAGYLALLFFAAMSLIALLVSWLVRFYDRLEPR
jgi:uncharacterized membrane protein